MGRFNSLDFKNGPDNSTSMSNQLNIDGKGQQLAGYREFAQDLKDVNFDNQKSAAFTVVLFDES